eukprot:9299582-Heterocapsa_arctica.AAC.1
MFVQVFVGKRPSGRALAITKGCATTFSARTVQQINNNVEHQQFRWYRAIGESSRYHHQMRNN